MRLHRGVRCAVPLVATLLLAACAQPPVVPDTPLPSPSVTAPPEEPITSSAFELRRHEQAHAFEKQGRWADAVAEWEVLALLRPDRADYRRALGAAKAHIEKGVAERLQAASDARVRGETEHAQQLYLKVLGLDPDNATAAQALREIEADRARRSRASRGTVVAKVDRITPAKSAADPSASAVERRELDYGSMLLRQGEYLASIRSFENYAKAHPKDELGRRYLADAYVQLAHQRLQQGKKEDALGYLEKASRLRGTDSQDISGMLASLRKALAEDCYQQGLRVQAVDIGQAIALWERAVRYDPSHVNAAARLQQGRQMEKNLKAIHATGSKR